MGYQRIKRAHQYAGDQAQHNAPRGGGFGSAVTLAIGSGVQHNGHCDQRDAAKEQQRIARRANQIAGDRAHNQRQANAYREGDGQTGNLDGGHQQQIGYVEDHSGKGRQHDGAERRLHHIRQESSP